MVNSSLCECSTVKFISRFPVAFCGPLPVAIEPQAGRSPPATFLYSCYTEPIQNLLLRQLSKFVVYVIMCVSLSTGCYIISNNVIIIERRYQLRDLLNIPDDVSGEKTDIQLKNILLGRRMRMRTHSEEHVSLLTFVHYFMCLCFSKFCLLSTFVFHFRHVKLEKKRMVPCCVYEC